MIVKTIGKRYIELPPVDYIKRMKYEHVALYLFSLGPGWRLPNTGDIHYVQVTSTNYSEMNPHILDVLSPFGNKDYLFWLSVDSSEIKDHIRIGNLYSKQAGRFRFHRYTDHASDEYLVLPVRNVVTPENYKPETSPYYRDMR